MENTLKMWLRAYIAFHIACLDFPENSQLSRSQCVLRLCLCIHPNCGVQLCAFCAASRQMRENAHFCQKTALDGDFGRYFNEATIISRVCSTVMHKA